MKREKFILLSIVIFQYSFHMKVNLSAWLFSSHQIFLRDRCTYIATFASVAWTGGWVDEATAFVAATRCWFEIRYEWTEISRSETVKAPLESSLQATDEAHRSAERHTSHHWPPVRQSTWYLCWETSAIGGVVGLKCGLWGGRWFRSEPNWFSVTVLRVELVLWNSSSWIIQSENLVLNFTDVESAFYVAVPKELYV